MILKNKKKFKMNKFYKKEVKNLINQIKDLDKTVIVVLIIIPVLTTISWYFTSRSFFRDNFYTSLFNQFQDIELVEIIYWFLSDSITFAIIPILIILFYFKGTLKNFGMNFQNRKKGFLFILPILFIIIPLTYFLSKNSEFSNYYPMLESVNYDWQTFLIFEILLFFYVFAWEFMWRGFVLFGLEKKFGFYAVFLQMIPFVIMHNGKPLLETLASIGGGLLLGYIAIRTRSIFYGVLIHFSLIFSLDLFCVFANRVKALL